MLQYLCSLVTAEDRGQRDMNRNKKVNKEQHLKAAGHQEDLTGEDAEDEGFYVDSFRNIAVSLGSKDLRWGPHCTTRVTI